MNESKKIKATALGISFDMGLLAETRLNSNVNLKIFVLLLRLVPAVLLWFLTKNYLKIRYFGNKNIINQKVRTCTRKYFLFLCSKNNAYEAENGFLNRISKFFGHEIEFTNASRIGYSLNSVVKSLDSLPKNQNIYFIHLGGMDMIYNTPPNEIGTKIRTLLQYIGENNTNVHVVLLVPANFINVLTATNNSLKILNIPFAPTADFLLWKQGFRIKFPLTCESSPEKIQEVNEYFVTCENKFEEELNYAINNNHISSGTFLKNADIKELFEEKNRCKFYALDGMHLSAEGHKKLVESHWDNLKQSLMKIDSWYNNRKRHYRKILSINKNKKISSFHFFGKNIQSKTDRTSLELNR